jgi:hypothetical protein
MADEFFDLSTYCSHSESRLHHRDIKSPRCYGCGKLRPMDSSKTSSKPTIQTIQTIHPSNSTQIIDLVDDSPTSTPITQRTISAPSAITTTAPRKSSASSTATNPARRPPPPPSWCNFTIHLARPKTNSQDWDHFVRAMNTRFANDIIDGFWSLHAMLLSAAKSPLG